MWFGYEGAGFYVFVSEASSVMVECGSACSSLLRWTGWSGWTGWFLVLTGGEGWLGRMIGCLIINTSSSIGKDLSVPGPWQGHSGQPRRPDRSSPETPHSGDP